MEDNKGSNNSRRYNRRKPEEIISGSREQIKKLEKQLIDLKKNEKELRGREENFRDIFETVTEGIAYTTLAGKIIYINSSFEKIIGTQREKIIGRNILEVAGNLLDAEDQSKILPYLKSLINGKKVNPFQVFYKDRILEVNAKINLKTRSITGTIRDITERKNSEIALKTSEARLRRAELASRSGNWELHLDTGIIIGSEGAMKLYGVKQTPMDYSFIKEVPLPEYRVMMDKALIDLIKNNKPYDIEFKIRNRETGEILDIHSISEYDRDNQILFGSIQDITSRKKIEEELKIKSDNLSKLLELTMTLFEITEKRKLFSKIVEGVPHLIGLKSGAIYMVEGENLYLETCCPPLPPDFPEMFRKASLKNNPNILKSVKTKKEVIINDTSKVLLTPDEKLIIEKRDLRSIIYFPLIVDNEVKAVLIFGSIGVQHDFTDDEKSMCTALSYIASAALENTLLVSNLMVAKEKAEESDRLKTAFLHNISHEIRTPLNAIIGFSGLLDQPDISRSEKESYYDIIVQSNNQLLSIINDIINISQVESGQVVLREKRTNLNQVFKNIFLQFQPEAKRKNLEFILEPELPDNDIIVMIDESKLIQIMSNLLNNALKFTKHGTIKMGFKIQDKLLTLSVEDTGIGIAKSEQSRIFDRFYQVEQSLTKLYGGTGLGLSITDAYVRLMGGRISLRSDIEKGSLFSVLIPYKQAEGSNEEQE